MAFDATFSSDTALAQEIARRVSMEIPPECVEGVAANARIIQRHVDIMDRGAASDESQMP